MLTPSASSLQPMGARLGANPILSKVQVGYGVLLSTAHGGATGLT